MDEGHYFYAASTLCHAWVHWYSSFEYSVEARTHPPHRVPMYFPSVSLLFDKDFDGTKSGLIRASCTNSAFRWDTCLKSCLKYMY